jgi:hypothetical protein
VNVTNIISTRRVVLYANGGVSYEDHRRIRTLLINSIVPRKIASLASWMRSS